MVVIELGNIGSEEQAEKIKNTLTGKSFFNFRVEFCCNVNNWPVVVRTEYEGAEDRIDEVKEMIMFCLACAL